MKRIIILFVNVIIIYIKLSHGQQQFFPASPCPDIFSYKQNNGEIFGLIVVNNIRFNNDNVVEIISTNNNDGQGRQLDVIQDQKTLFNDVKNGRPVYFKFSFGSSNQIPEIFTIKLNGVTICKNLSFRTINKPNSISPSYISPEEIDVLSDILRLSEIPYQTTNVERGNPIELFPRETEYSSIQPIPQDRINQQPQRTNFHTPHALFNELTDNCGKTRTFSINLIIGAENLEEGTWPWLVPLYYKSAKKFVCGGSLLSRTSILTAAHCFQSKDKNDYGVGIGVFNLNRLNLESLKSVRQFFIHPEYPENKADIAVILLETAVGFNDNIRPICLWNYSNKIASNSGAVAGWGLSDPRIESHTDKPSIIRSIIVPNDECLRSHSAFREITSNATFCAKAPDERGPCKGDSGGGLMIEYNGKWFLRGVVSQSLADPVNKCDLKEFIVYTDIFKFLDWIRNHMTF